MKVELPGQLSVKVFQSVKLEVKKSLRQLATLAAQLAELRQENPIINVRSHRTIHECKFNLFGCPQIGTGNLIIQSDRVVIDD